MNPRFWNEMIECVITYLDDLTVKNSIILHYTQLYVIHNFEWLNSPHYCLQQAMDGLSFT